MMKIRLMKSRKTWIWDKYQSKTRKGNLVSLRISFRFNLGNPGTPQHSDSHPCTVSAALRNGPGTRSRAGPVNRLVQDSPVRRKLLIRKSRFLSISFRFFVHVISCTVSIKDARGSETQVFVLKVLQKPCFHKNFVLVFRGSMFCVFWRSWG